MYESCDPPFGQIATLSGGLVGLEPIVVYTAITAGYDTLKEQPHASRSAASFVAFLDEPRESSTWRCFPIHGAFSDANRNAKIHKVLSHISVPDAQYTLWIDGSVTLRSADSIHTLVDAYLTDCDLAVFQHRVRTCVYQEASVCLQRRLDDPEIIWQQICRYTREGYPPNAGLSECTVILRRHTAQVKAFNEAWWEEIRRGSKRDQLSFDYVARKLGLCYRTLPGSISDNPWFQRGTHAANGAEPAVAAPAPSTEPGAPLLQTPVGAEESAGATRPRFYHSAKSSSRRRRKTLAFGRIRDKPSWSWVGFDVARELSKDFDVVLCDSSSALPDCDVLFVVKKRPSDLLVSRALQAGVKLVYCPVDAYHGVEEIETDAGLLASCSMLLVHCERLLPLLARHCSNAHFVEHHTRYALNETAAYRESGFILWIGSCQYVPYLVRWLEDHPIDHEIKILTDIDNDGARALARKHAEEIGMALEIGAEDTSIAGCRVYRWSERRQQEMMRACKAALDVKMTRFFCQYHKPPTKAQKYIASGIPFAVNPESYSAEYFRARGFDVASPLDTERWFSREYWKATRLAGDRLRADTSIEAVAARYRELIESL